MSNSIARVQHQLRATRERSKTERQSMEANVATGLAAYLVGMLENSGKLPVAFIATKTHPGGIVPAKLALAGGAALLAMNSSGSTSRAAAEAAKAAFAIYSYEAGKTGSFVAG